METIAIMKEYDAERCVEAITHLSEEGKDPSSYYLVLSGDALTADLLWNKEKGDPPTHMSSGLPDEPGSWPTQGTYDLSHGANYFLQFIAKGPVSTVAGSNFAYWGFYSEAKCRQAIDLWAKVNGYRVQSWHPCPGVGPSLDAVLRASRCPDLRISVRSHGQGVPVKVLGPSQHLHAAYMAGDRLENRSWKHGDGRVRSQLCRIAADGSYAQV